MALDISGWNLGPRRNFCVGPVVGRVTGDTARILVESAGAVPATVTAATASGGDVVFTTEQTLQCKVPFAFEITGLEPGQRYNVTFTIGEETRTCGFTTPSPDRTTWKVGLVSCNKLAISEKGNGTWDLLAAEAPGLDVILHMGDQVYGDEEFHRGRKAKKQEKITEEEHEQNVKHCWGKSRALCLEAGMDNLEPLRPTIKEIYARLYRETWSFPPTAATLASVSNLVVLDDHEITDDAGDIPEHCDPNSWQYFVMKCAYEVYLLYQAQLNGPVEDVTDWERTSYWHTQLFPGVGLFFLDVRMQRSLHRHQQEGADWTDKQYLGPRQWADFKHALSRTYRGSTTMIVVSPTPPLFVSAFAANMIAPQCDDILGSWGHDKYKNEQKELLETLSEWQEATPNRAVAMCGGDVHIGGFADVQLKKHGPVLNQITASAVANEPEGGSDALNLVGYPLLALADFHVSMRVNHDKWVFEPNYGVMTIDAPPGTGKDPERPKISAKLVTKKTTLRDEFTYSN